MKLSRVPGEANRPSADPAAPADAGAAGAAAAHGLRPGLDGLRDLMDRLLAEDGCPWDRAQTLDDLRPYLVEETYEVLDAMADPKAHRGELGDLLFQIVFQSAIREREGAFDLDDVVAGIVAKLVRRHPHVFGADRGEALTPEDVERRWAQTKARERGALEGPRAVLERLPRGLAPLARAAKLQRAAADLGFDWPDVDGAMAKLAEETGELQEARSRGDAASMKDELGDLFFVLVRIGQKLGIDAADALSRANEKFERRFGAVLDRCHAEGIDPATAGLSVLDAHWNAAKADERGEATRQRGGPSDPAEP